MADIITGTVSGMVDTSELVRDSADIRRETALEAGEVRRDVVANAYAVSKDIHAASDVGQRDAAFNSAMAGRDASAYYIADVATQNQLAKELSRSQAWTEAKVDSGFIKVAGDTALSTAITSGVTALEIAKLNGAMALQHAVQQLQAANEGNATRALINANRIDELRDKSGERYMKIVELEGDRKHCDRDYDRLNHSMQQNQFASLQSQLQAFNSDLQTTKQGVINFGSGTATGGAQSTMHA